MKKIRILAISSSGGHWIQLNRLRPFLDSFDTVYASTDDTLGEVFDEKFYSLKDASMWDKPGLVILAFQVFWLLLKVRPDVVISTGAAPGFFALLFGKILMRKTIWVDSMANADEMSLAGRKIKPFVDVWLTQWEDLATTGGPSYRGQVL